MIISTWLIGIMTSNLLSYPQICPIIINRTVFQHENYLKQGLQKFGQAGGGSGLLVSVSLLDGLKNSTKRLSHFLLWSSIRYYIGTAYSQKDLFIFSPWKHQWTIGNTETNCLFLLLYTKKEKNEKRMKRVTNTKTKKNNYFSATTAQLGRWKLVYCLL